MAQAPDLSARRAALSPRARAFTDHSTGRVWSFAEVEAQAQALAVWMRRFGRGARIGLLAFNRAESFIALFAARKAGVILCPLNWRAPLPELAAVAASVGISALIHDADHAALARDLCPDAPPKTASPDGAGLASRAGQSGVAAATNRLQMQANGGFALACEVPPAPVADMAEDDCWYLLFTSGTTGRPKAVIQTSRMAQGVAINLAQALGLSAQDSTLCHLPFFHTAGINLVTLPLFQWGGHSHILPRHDAEALLDLVAARELSQLFAVPTVWQALADHPRFEAAGFEHLRGLISGGAVLSEALARRYAARGAVLRNGFGMTETGPTGFLIDAEDALRHPGAVGKPQIMTEARLAGVPDGVAGEGELLLRGSTVTPGYFGDPQATEAAFEAGWLKTGDVAARDAQGLYRIIDRLKDMYVSGGENVWPAEVEAVLAAHPAVAEAAVTAAPDPRWGETGRAHLRLAPGHEALPEDLERWCRERLAAYKVPQRFEIVADFPRTPSGKIRKQLLQEGT